MVCVFERNKRKRKLCEEEEERRCDERRRQQLVSEPCRSEATVAARRTPCEGDVSGARWTPLAARCRLRWVCVFIIVELRHERWREVCCPVSCGTGGKEVMAMERRPLPRGVPCPSRRQGVSSSATWRRVTGELCHR
ncbi:hypothetical protein VPH35_124504 [Triticum aestivum]